MTSNIPAGVRTFLEKSLKKNLDNFTVEINEGNKQGQGYWGDFFFVSLTDKTTNEIHRLAIKQALPSKTSTSSDFISNLFHNESCFYERIWPAFTKFQNGFPGAEKFNNISKCYAVEGRKGAEKLSFENLKYKGFINHNKTEFFKREQLELVLMTYGRFHAVSMAFRQQEPQRFQEVTEGQIDVFKALFEMPFIGKTLQRYCQVISANFDSGRERNILEKFKIYVDKGADISIQSRKYNGKHPVLLHGDCWSNNIMFKYNDQNEIEDLKLIDFQLALLGTVVYDLSYCIYASAAAKETLENLDHYLRVYHQSLSEALRGYGLDPESVYPFEVLKQEWKQYSKFGLITGILVNGGKFQESESAVDLSELLDEEENGMKDSGEDYEGPFKLPPGAMKTFMGIGRNLVVHAYDNDYL